MGKEDHLTKQINQLGYFLQKLKEKLLGGGLKDAPTEAIEETNKALRDAIGIDLEFIITVPEEKLVPILTGNIAFTPANLELLADVLIAISPEQYAKKALLLYRHVNETTKVFSLERETKIKEIQRYL